MTKERTNRKDKKHWEPPDNICTRHLKYDDDDDVSSHEGFNGFHENK